MGSNATENLDDLGLILEGENNWVDFQPQQGCKSDFNDEDFHSIPRSCGIYEVYTSASIEELKNERSISPEELDPKHYNLKEKIEASSAIPEKFRADRKIKVEDHDLMMVYNGQTYNLRQRIKEHFLGVKGNGCIAALNGYQDHFWYFRYFDLSRYNNSNNQVFRNFLEQKFRAKYGWPILCKV